MVTKQLKVEGHTSYAPCPICGNINGISGNGGAVGGGSKRIGHRCFLSWKHFLRSWGQSETCCPRGFYEDHKPVKKIDATHPCTIPLNISDDVDQICDNGNLNNVKSFLNQKDSRFVWHHNDYADITSLRNYVYYNHADYRPQKPFSRVMYDTITHTEQSRSFNGYKPWFMHLYYFSVAESLSWCVFHAKMGVGRHTLKEFTNESITDRKNFKPFKDYLKTVLCHPYLYEVEELDGSDNKKEQKGKNKTDDVFEKIEKEENNKQISITNQASKVSEKESYVADRNAMLRKLYGRNNPQLLLPKNYLYQTPWKVKASELKDIEAFVNSLHVPAGLTDKFQIHDIFSRQGQLRGAEVITILEDLMDYMLKTCTLPDGYKLYYSMLSSDIREMGKPQIKSDAVIDEIFKKIAETISTHEGMFPIFFSDFVFHELVDIVPHIKSQGPQKSFSTIQGERANAVLKHFVRKGGRNCTLTVLNNYTFAEAHTTRMVYSNMLESNDIDAVPKGLRNNLIFHISKSNRNKICSYEFNKFLFIMSRKVVQKDNLTDYEMLSLLSTLLFEVEKNFQSPYKANESTLYQIFSTWLQHSKYTDSRKLTQHDQFFLWLRNEYITNKTTFDKDPVINEFFRLKYSICRNCFKSCSIYGTEFSSRGLNYRIKEDLHFIEDVKTLRKEWWGKQQYSSWCQYKESTSLDWRPYSSYTSTEVAQLNAFFRIHLPSDIVLNGVPIASISHRPTVVTDRLFSYQVNENNINGQAKLFISATNIIPCRQLIAGFDADNHPWKFRGKEFSIHSRERKDKVSYILCIPLDRKNDCLEYNPRHNKYYNTNAFDDSLMDGISSKLFN
jgi:hypothetical protein